MVLTTQTKEDIYAATMEPQNATEEDSLFDNISNTRVPTPPGFTNDPNDKEVSQLDGSDGNNTLPRVGPAIVLKVMAGDTITIATQAWYQSAVQPPPSGANNLLNDLLNALTGGVITNSHSLYSTTDNNPNSVLSGDLGQFFTNDENDNYTTSAPKAFLNWVTFDNQMNMVSGNSGVVQVPQISAGETAQPLIAPQLIIQKDGYIYIYVSNESAMKVYFDNLVIHHNRGPILQENSYYPYGLTMAGISDQAAMMPENKQLFNDGSELQHDEFSDRTGLDWYNMPYRNYDPQIGMFHNIDPMPSDMISPYSYAIDNPLMFEDPSGGTEEQVVDLPTIFDNLEHANPFGDYGGSWSSDGGGDGSYDYFSSNSDAFEATAFSAMSSGYGEWGTNPAGAYAGAFYNYVTSTGNVDIPNYATFRSEFFQTLPQVTINVNDPNSWDAAQNTILNELEQSLNGVNNGSNSYSPNDILANIAGSAGLALNLTSGSILGAQRLGKLATGINGAITDLNTLAGFRIASKSLAGLGALTSYYNLYTQGPNPTTVTDAIMGTMGLIPGLDIVSGVYFISNFIVENTTGKSVGDYIYQGISDNSSYYEEYGQMPLPDF